MPDSWRTNLNVFVFPQGTQLPRGAFATLAWLLAFVLAAACGRPQTGELPPTGFKVVFESHSVPKEMKVGEQTNAEVRVRNASSVTWPSKPNDKKKFEVQFSYHWLSGSGAMVIFDGLRTALPHDLKPGTSVELRPAIQAPPRPGNYVLELTLVQEGKAWFPEIDDDNKVSVPVTVTDARSGSDGAQDGRDKLSSADSQDGKAKKNRKDKKRESHPRAANEERPNTERKQDNSWAIQVGAFPDEKDAKTSAAQLKDKGYDAFVVKSEVKGKSWYRVRVGHLASRAEAEKLQAKLTNQQSNEQFLIVQNR